MSKSRSVGGGPARPETSPSRMRLPVGRDPAGAERRTTAGRRQRTRAVTGTPPAASTAPLDLRLIVITDTALASPRVVRDVVAAEQRRDLLEHAEAEILEHRHRVGERDQRADAVGLEVEAVGRVAAAAA